MESLIALYEYKVFLQSIIWNINPFDQQGIKLGKEFAGKIYAQLKQSGKVFYHDSSTNGLMNYFKASQ